MKVRIGNDILDIKKFNKSSKQSKFLENVFSPSELKNPNTEHLAGLFAAKEAIMKALDLKPGSWLKIEISNTRSGKPIVKFSNEIKNKIFNYDLSISHNGKYALATFVVLLNDSRKR